MTRRIRVLVFPGAACAMSRRGAMRAHRLAQGKRATVLVRRVKPP